MSVLEDLVDHTNVGAVSATPRPGIDAVLVSPECADPLYRRSVKVSMGAVFAVPGPAPSRGRSRWTCCATRIPHARDVTGSFGTFLRDADLRPPVAIVLGTEGEGLTAAALERCTRRVRIPMSAGVDSLNVAAASAVVLYDRGGAGPRSGVATSVVRVAPVERTSS